MSVQPTEDNERRQLIEEYLELYREYRKPIYGGLAGKERLPHEDVVEVVIGALVSVEGDKVLRTTCGDLPDEPDEDDTSPVSEEDMTALLQRAQRRNAWFRLARDILAVIAALDSAKADIPS